MVPYDRRTGPRMRHDRVSSLRCTTCGKMLFWDADESRVEFVATVQFRGSRAIRAWGARDGVCAACVREREGGTVSMAGL